MPSKRHDPPSREEHLELRHALHDLTHKADRIMALLDDVVSKVTALSTVEDSVIALLTDIKAKLDAAIAGGADPAKLQALSDAIDAQKQKLTDAVTANTPTP
jgi:hypothetical protein